MIKKYRKLNNLTQEELAEKIGISTRQIQRLEKGSDIPSFTTLQKLVLVLNISDKDLAEYVRNQSKSLAKQV